MPFYDDAAAGARAVKERRVDTASAKSSSSAREAAAASEARLPKPARSNGAPVAPRTVARLASRQRAEAEVVSAQSSGASSSAIAVAGIGAAARRLFAGS